MKISFLNTDISNGWLFNFSRIISSLIPIPFILLTFSSDISNVWLLFYSIVSISDIFLFGLDSTFIRFISYTKANIHFSNFHKIKELKVSNQKDTKKQFSDIFYLLIILFSIISIFYFFFLWFSGLFFLDKPISFINNNNYIWYSWYFIISANFIRIFFYPYAIILQGINKMKIYYKLGFIVNFFLSISNLCIMIFNPSVFYLSISIFLFSIINSILHVYFILFKYNKVLYSIFIFNFNFKLLKLLWSNIWKSATPKLFSTLIQHISGIIFSQISSSSASVSYLIIQRFFNLLSSFSNITVNAKIPTIAHYRGLGKIFTVNQIIERTSRISYFIILIGYFVSLLIFQNIISFINNFNFGVNLISPDFFTIMLFSFAHLFNRSGGIQLLLSNQANHIIEHKAILFYAFFYFGILMLFSNALLPWVFPFALLVSSLLTNVIYVYPRTYILYNTNFWDSEKKSFLLVLILNILISLIMYRVY